MPRFKHTRDILQLMSEKEFIRNLGILAHIDHGKTTLTDSLLAGTGLLSPQVAGSARVLDYLEEEQKRGITMKTANISMLYRAANSSFIINLVDTPGHVDFTGKVTRALRTIDGAVVLVDAVEEVMAQTELVLRQALEERVRPVLFINKVDRLITELKFTEEQIQKKFTRIIGFFNDLIEMYGESPFKEKWKFRAVIGAYENAEFEKLRESLPLHAAILDMVVKHVPNPLEAQKYRVEKIWKGNVTSDMGKAMTNCDDNGPTVACITNVQANLNGDLIATGRVFSGTVKSGDGVYLVNAQAEHVVQQVSVYMGALRETVDQVSAGNLAALSGLETVRAGETIVGRELKEKTVPFERIRYVSEPVMTVAVEPKNPKELSELLAGMKQLEIEDPNLAILVNKDTGEHLFSGMGELHLEIAVKHLKVMLGGMEVSVSPPRVVYRENATMKGAVAVAWSPNKQNKFTVQVKPIDEEDETRSPENIIAVGENKNVLTESIAKPEQLQDILDFVVSGFRFACRAGPLCGEPMRGVEVNLMEIQLSENSEQRDPVEVMSGVGKAVFGSFLSANPVLLEPFYKTVISSPTELAGQCSRIITRRRGKISAFEHKGAFTVITSFIPVSETFGLPEKLRSATSGRAFWQSMFDRWEKVPENLEAKIIIETRKRKGLPSEVPKAERFLEENR
jgi:elongation factor 2